MKKWDPGLMRWRICQFPILALAMEVVSAVPTALLRDNTAAVTLEATPFVKNFHSPTSHPTQFT